MRRARAALHGVTAMAIVAFVLVAAGVFDAQPARAHVAVLRAPVTFPETAAPVSTAAPTTVLPTTTAVPTTVPPTTAAPPPTTVAPPAPVAPPPPTPTVPFTPQLVARITSPVLYLYQQPGGAMLSYALAGATWFGNPWTLPVVQQGGDWLEVLLPVRPNGSTAWIRAKSAQLLNVVDRVTVDRATHTLVWTHAGVVQMAATVGVGAPSTPTPSGVFFVTDVLPQDPSGPYGAWTIALDAHPDTFSVFEGGDATIAIHGTNNPSTIGADASLGCVHVGAADLDVLAHSLPLGTPVTIW